MNKLDEFRKALDVYTNRSYSFHTRGEQFCSTAMLHEARAALESLYADALRDAERLDHVIDMCESPPWQPFWYSGTDDYRAKARIAIDAALEASREKA